MTFQNSSNNPYNIDGHISSTTHIFALQKETKYKYMHASVADISVHALK